MSALQTNPILAAPASRRVAMLTGVYQQDSSSKPPAASQASLTLHDNDNSGHARVTHPLDFGPVISTNGVVLQTLK
jgi:hypothetical protein